MTPLLKKINLIFKEDGSSREFSSSNISVDLPFITTQTASILAGRLGGNYFEIIILNIVILASFKIVIFLSEKIIDRRKNNLQ
jgi:hypothetical protein